MIGSDLLGKVRERLHGSGPGTGIGMAATWGVPAGLAALNGLRSWKQGVDREQQQRSLAIDLAANARQIQQLQDIKAVEQGRMQQAMLRSMARLAQADPHFYNELMMGRRLPLGAVVLGGQPRTDVLQDVAYAMANGEFDRQAALMRQLQTGMTPAMLQQQQQQQQMMMGAGSMMGPPQQGAF